MSDEAMSDEAMRVALAQALRGEPATLNPNLARQGIRATPWHKEFVQNFGERADLGPGADYDYLQAWAAGVRPERDPYDQNRYHWPSSLPNGQMLKAPNHPTAWKEHYMRATGVNPDSVGATEQDWMRMGK